MKNKGSFLPIFLLLLAACSPQTAAPAASFALTDEGLFSGPAEIFLLTEEGLAGQYIKAFGPVDRTNVPATQSPEMDAYHEATGLLSSWVIQFVRPLGSGTNTSPAYIVNYATVYSSLEGPAIAASPNWASGLYEGFNTGEITQWPDSPDIEAEQIIYQTQDGIFTVVVYYRNIGFSFLAEGIDNQETYDYLTLLAGLILIGSKHKSTSR
jgi:hypothetical protein